MIKDHQKGNLLTKHMKFYSNTFKTWARPGFEPGTTRTLSEYHTPRPTSLASLAVLILVITS